MENLSLAGEEDLYSQNKKLKALLQKTITELKLYSEGQFGDSAKSSVIYQLANKVDQEFSAIIGDTL